MNEKWLPVVGFEEHYEVSSHGRIRRISSGRILKQTADKRGYRQVYLSVQGRTRTGYVHRLVALAFLGPEPFAGAHVRHWDGNPGNNAAVNLRWGTAAQNAEDRSRHGRHYSRYRGVTHCIRQHEFTEENTRRTKGGRSCKKCEALHTRNYRARLREKEEVTDEVSGG